LRPGFLSRVDATALAEALVKMPGDVLDDPRLKELCSRAGLTAAALKTARHTIAAKRQAEAVASPEELFAIGYNKSLTPQEEKLQAHWDRIREEVLVESREMQEAASREATERAKKGAAARHVRDLEKREKMRQIWASGRFSSRLVCAEQEAAGVGISIETARKALRRTPNPDPWPAKARRSRP